MDKTNDDALLTEVLNRGGLTFQKHQIFNIFENVDLISRNKYDGTDKTSLIAYQFVTACLK